MTTFTVTTAADVVDPGDGKLSLREAVAQANASVGADRIVFASGLEGKTLALAHGELLVTHDLTIDGDANNDGVRVTIAGSEENAELPTGRIFRIAGSSTDVALRDLTLTRGDADADNGTGHEGGAIFLGGGSLGVTGCTISGNRSGYADGGGIFADDGSRLTITSSQINHNGAPYAAGGGIFGGSDVTVIIRDSEVSDNRGNYGGIGVTLGAGSSLTMEDSSVRDNFSDEGGGRGVSVLGTADIARSTISGNYGGGIAAEQLTLTDSTVAGNFFGIYGGSGGGIGAGDLVIRNSTVTGNSAAGGTGFTAHGGGILADHIDISNSIVAGNTLGDYSSGSPDIFGTIVASDGHNVFGSAIAGSIPGDVENVPGAALFADFDPLTGGGLVGPSGIVQLLNDVANPAVSAADLLAASATGQTGASRPLPAGSLPDIGSVEIGQPLSTSPSANNDVITDGSAGHTIKALAGADYVKGMGGADTLYGGAGSDLLDGGPGNDKLYGDAGIDFVFYGGSTKVTVDLSLATDKATRGSETDTLYKVEGAIGSSAADTFKGDGGANWFQGGLGRDIYTGGGGRDLYDFNSVADSKPGSARDLVKDFAHLTDKLDLAGIDADTGVAGNQAFHWVGTDALTGPGEVGFFTSGGDTIVQASTDADAAAEFQIQLAGIKVLSATDFYF